MNMPADIVAAYGPYRPWQWHQERSTQVAQEGLKRADDACDAAEPLRRNRTADSLYAHFAAAAESLLLGRQPHDHHPPTHRGWPLQARTAPVRAAKPEGWISEPDGSSTWAALDSSLTNYSSTLQKGGTSPAIARARDRVVEAHRRAAALPRILDDPDDEVTVLRQVGELTRSGSADEVRKVLLQGLKPLVKRLRCRLLGRRGWTFRNWITN